MVAAHIYKIDGARVNSLLVNIRRTLALHRIARSTEFRVILSARRRNVKSIEIYAIQKNLQIKISGNRRIDSTVRLGTANNTTRNRKAPTKPRAQRVQWSTGMEGARLVHQKLSRAATAQYSRSKARSSIKRARVQTR